MSPTFKTRAPGRGVAGINCPALFGFSSSSPPQSSWNSIVKELSISGSATEVSKTDSRPAGYFQPCSDILTSNLYGRAFLPELVSLICQLARADSAGAVIGCCDLSEILRKDLCHYV